MKINEIVWSDKQIDHIARHDVSPQEFEDVCFGYALVLKARSEGENPVYYFLGQTSFGRYLFCVMIRFLDGNGYPITARTMSEKEKQRFNRWKK